MELTAFSPEELLTIATAVAEEYAATIMSELEASAVID
jgi:hypothetical protein